MPSKPIGLTVVSLSVTVCGEPLSVLHLSALGADAMVEGRQIHIAARQGLGVAACSDVPLNSRLHVRICPQPGSAGFGLVLRAGERFDSGYDLHFSPYERVASLNDQRIFGVDGLDRPFALDIVLKQDIIDVCIDRRRTLIDRCPERHGDRVLFYGQDSDITFHEVEIASLP